MSVAETVPWRPGCLAPGVYPSRPNGIHQGYLMKLIGHAMQGGADTRYMENVEVAISVVDDAIANMIWRGQDSKRTYP